jgi:membrane protein implicated in regulation of membrane protease activity
MNEQDPKSGQSFTKNIARNLLVSASAGCLTIFVAGAALIAGLLIDARLATAPRWTLILLIGSAPFTLGGVYLIVRRALKRSREERQSNKEQAPEDDIKPG